jgi:hypothetical protein
VSLTDESTKSEKSLLSVARLPLLPLYSEKRDSSEKRISFLKFSLEPSVPFAHISGLHAAEMHKIDLSQEWPRKCVGDDALMTLLGITELKNVLEYLIHASGNKRNQTFELLFRTFRFRANTVLVVGLKDE